MPFTETLHLDIQQNPEDLSLEDLKKITAHARGMNLDKLQGLQIEKASLDARKGRVGWKVRVVGYEVGEKIPLQKTSELVNFPANRKKDFHVAIIGSGPSGLFCAMQLAQQGIKFTILERGKDVQERRKDIANLNRGNPVAPQSNYCFGEGGAGTYSDGKLYARSAEKEDARQVLETLVAYGAPSRILWSWRPHIGSNLLPKIIKSIREGLERVGCVHFNSLVTEIIVDNGEAKGLRLENGKEILADAVVLATGHSSLDSILIARKAGALLSPKGFALGVRVEHSQKWLDARQYRGKAKLADLPPSFYELSAKIDERSVYSFCMCPGGWIVPTQTATDSLSVNGMSLSRRNSPYANSGLVVELRPKDWCGKRGWRWGWSDSLKKAAEISKNPLLHELIKDPRGGREINVNEGRLPVHPDIDPLFGIRIQKALEVLACGAGGGKSHAPAQIINDFVNESPPKTDLLSTSYHPGIVPTNFNELLPQGISRRLREALKQFDQKLPGYINKNAQIIGVETRTSSPVRIDRDDKSRQSISLKNLYPCGEGAGYAGGIVSAAIDGLKTAEAIKLHYKN